MKKLVSIAMAVVILICLGVTAYAAGPMMPRVDPEKQPPDYCVPVGNIVTLWVDASVDDGGTLTYIWYKTDVPEMQYIMALDNQMNPELVLSSNEPSISYYCCGVWNTKDGMEAGPVYTRLIMVEFFEAAEKSKPSPAHIKSEMPNCEQYVGEELVLWCDAMSPDGGLLSYCWYETDKPDASTLKPIDGETSEEIKIKKDKPGVTYYCCAVWNSLNDFKSEPVYSRMIKVEYFEKPGVNPGGENDDPGDVNVSVLTTGVEEDSSKMLYYVIAALAGLALILLIALIVVSIRRKKNDNNNGPTPGAPQQNFGGNMVPPQQNFEQNAAPPMQNFGGNMAPPQQNFEQNAAPPVQNPETNKFE